MTQVNQDHYYVIIGSYAEPSETGIYVFSLDTSSGELTLHGGADGMKNPSFLDIDQQGKVIYAIHQKEGEQGPIGMASSYTIDLENGHLTRLNEERTVARPTCHIQYQATGSTRYLLVTSYHGGLVGLAPVLEDGRIGPLKDVHTHEGQLGPHTARQDRPHPHSAFLDPEQRFVYVPDLGLDIVKIYELDVESLTLRPVKETRTAPGAGPRHLTFHPSLPYLYVINELDSTITRYARNAENGEIESLQTVSTLPETFEGSNTCAEIHISKDGKYIYGSNRGHDSIALFEVDPTDGALTYIETVPSGGKLPRNFALSPDGQFLIAAHQETGNLVVFRVDTVTGRLQNTGQQADAPGGVCVKFWNQPVNLS